MIEAHTHRVVLHGKNNTWEAPVSQWQADNATRWERPVEPWWQSLLLWIAIFTTAYLVWRIFA